MSYTEEFPEPAVTNKLAKKILDNLLLEYDLAPEQAMATDRVNKLRELAYQAVEAEFPEWPDTKISELAESFVEDYRVEHSRKLFQSGAALLRSTTPPFPFFESI